MPARPRPAREPGPIERTVVELRRLDEAASFRRRREARTRARLLESDALLACIEESRLGGASLVSTDVFTAVVRLVARTDPALRDELGSNRQLDHASNVLFAVQEELLPPPYGRTHRPPAPIIPLFPERPEAKAGIG